MLKLIRKILLKSKRVQRAVLTYQVKQRKQRHHENWKLIMSGEAVRDTKTEKSHKTSAIVDDDGELVEYMDGRFVNQRHVCPVFIDSTNWGR